MKLSSNFYLKEFVRSNTATRLGIRNNPPNELIPRLINLSESILEPIRHLCDNKIISITSGYRSLALNRVLKSSDNSQHIQCEAADFIIEGLTPYEVAKKIEDSDIGYDQLIYEFGEWVHISYTERRNNRHESLTIYKEDGRAQVKMGIQDV